MPIDTPCKEYFSHIKDYQLIADFLAGERRVKDRGTEYLPPLESHASDWFSYEAYKDFGTLFNALGRTAGALSGAILRKIPTYKGLENSGIAELLPNITYQGGSFIDLARETCSALVNYGRGGILIDVDSSGLPYATVYDSRSIIRWPTNNRDEESNQIVLKETRNKPTDEDRWETEAINRIRVLDLIDGVYTVEIYEQNEGEWEPVDVIIPLRFGLPLNFVPFYFTGADTNGLALSKPPLLDLAFLNWSHWKLSVGYHYGLFLVGLPTPVATGFNFEDDEGDDFALGPGSVLIGPQGARASYLEFRGDGLSTIVKAMEGLEDKMAVLGARFLEKQITSSRTATEIMLNVFGDSSSLATISTNASGGLSQALKCMAYWIGDRKYGDIEVTLNKDFVSRRMEPQTLLALTNAVQKGALSIESYLWNLETGEVLPPGTVLQDEAKKVGSGEKK